MWTWQCRHMAMQCKNPLIFLWPPSFEYIIDFQQRICPLSVLKQHQSVFTLFSRDRKSRLSSLAGWRALKITSFIVCNCELAGCEHPSRRATTKSVLLWTAPTLQPTSPTPSDSTPSILYVCNDANAPHTDSILPKITSLQNSCSKMRNSLQSNQATKAVAETETDI